jgi:type I restriction enzyme S subunit
VTLKLVTLEHVLEFIRGITFKPDDKVEPHSVGSVVCMRTKNIQLSLDESDILAVPKTFIKRDEQFLEEGDLLISSANSWELVGKTVRVSKLNYAATAGGFISILRPKREIVDPDYLYRFITHHETQHQIRHLGRQTTNISNLDRKRFLKLKIPLPPLPVQKQIAAVLEKADTLRSQCQQMEQELNSLAQSVFLDMFGDPVTNPKQWSVERLEGYIDYIGDIGSNGSNDTVSANLNMLDDEDYALMIRTTNFNKNDFTDNVKYVSKETYNFFKKSQIFGGEIIMNKIGSAGQFWIMPHLNRPVSLGLNQFVIRLKNLNTNFLYYYLSTEYGQKVIQSKLNGATTKSITKAAVKDLPLMLPPIELQNRFSSIVEKIKKLAPVSLNEQHEDNFNSLMQRAFKGELDLKDVA